MKKLISLSMLILACSLYSCSGDNVPQAGGKAVYNQDIGGQSGQLPPPPHPKQAIKHLSDDQSKS